ncbi:MAG: hypothetical protein IT384_27760 [Deltaproteobacteria bacterium]|nr:hypothetical protein [Deltaproteobacteria bacterium]
MFTRLCLTFAAAALGAACFGTEATVFPPGLEPLEDNGVSAQDPESYAESIAFAGEEAPEYIWVHGRGYLLTSPAEAWRIVKNADLMSLSCSADTHSYQVQNDPNYELAYLAHYAVESLVDVEWDEQWRFGTITGTPEDPERTMVRYQKVFGSTAIDLIEGSIQVIAPDDSTEVSELQFVEHLSAFGGSVEEVRLAMKYRFDTIVATLRGGELPACP